MVTVNFLHLVAVCAVAMLLCGFIGYGSGLKVGYLRGWLDCFNRITHPSAADKKAE